jgi:hypothetical protein
VVAEQPVVPAEVAETVGLVLRRWADIEVAQIPKRYLFNQHRSPEPSGSASAGCYEASFGWVHVRPGCRRVR